jgi:mannose-6-phosphate isomerase-like protein (cupin superfamily)
MSKMYYDPYMYRYPQPYYPDTPMYHHEIQPVGWRSPHEIAYSTNQSWHYPSYNQNRVVMSDQGNQPFVVNINEATKQNNTFRSALWTGTHLQVTLMSINVGEDIGLEMHPSVDQFLRVEDGQGIVRMGDQKDRLDFEKRVYDDAAIMIPAGKWHNIINTGNTPLKMYSIYAPPQHPKGTVHTTKAEAMAAEEHHG